jgi:hypothetical protein
MKPQEPRFWERVKREILKTTLIGKKMFSATRETNILKDLHELVGYALVQKIRKNEIQMNDQEINDLVKRIDLHEESLDALEQDVNQIKSS